MGKKYYKKFSWWIPVLLTLFLGFWAVQISINQGKITDDIRNISIDTNDKLSSAIGLINFEGMPSNGNVVEVKLTPNWTFYTWLTLYKIGNKNSYIFDIGDSFVKNRMSLFLDEYGFINWRIIDENYTIHSIRKDFNPFIGKRNLIVIVRQKNSFKLYVDKENYMEFNLTNSNFSIKSTDFYLGSDINGENKFYSEEKPNVNDFTN